MMLISKSGFLCTPFKPRHILLSKLTDLQIKPPLKLQAKVRATELLFHEL